MNDVSPLDEDIKPAALVIPERRIEFHNDGSYTDYAIAFRLRNDDIVAGGWSGPQALAEHIAAVFLAAALTKLIQGPSFILEGSSPRAVDERVESSGEVGMPAIQWFPDSEVVE